MKKIAIIGSGISGMSAAYLLRQKYDITLFEKNGYIGGHARTIELERGGQKIAVDTGFIVYNHRNYANLKALFALLGVETIMSPMTFGSSVNQGVLEYAVTNLQTIFAQKRNLFRPRFFRMIYDFFRFKSQSLELLDSDDMISLGDYLKKNGYSHWFRDYFLLPMGGSIWSTPLEKMEQFPAQTFVRFFHNHGLLTVDDQPQWYTVKGGSREYVKLLTEPFADRIFLNREILGVSRRAGYVEIEDTQGKRYEFDEVVIAAHGDQALAMLKDPSREEREILSRFHYQPNLAVTHGDETLMPSRRKTWGSWVFLMDEARGRKEISLSYWMNNLQSIDKSFPLFVTLNPFQKIDETKIYDEFWFEHPLYDQDMILAQRGMDSIQGRDRIWFCGAYQRYGFHEDGILSAVKVAEKMGVVIPWH